MQCGIPEEQVPAFGPELPRPPVSAPPPSIPSPAAEIPRSTDTVLFSVSYAEFMASKPVWAKKTRAQAEAVMSRFISLMDDKAVPDITQAVAERRRSSRLRCSACDYGSGCGLGGRTRASGSTPPALFRQPWLQPACFEWPTGYWEHSAEPSSNPSLARDRNRRKGAPIYF